MKICFMCDLHLPRIMSALQYDALNFAVADVLRKKADCIVVAGDITCDGNFTVYNWFVKKMNKLPIPVIFIPGNSDLRDKNSRDAIKAICSPCKTNIGDVSVFALNDCDRTVSESDIKALETADDNSIVFMHHPIASHSPDTVKALQDFRRGHKNTMMFYAHKHISLSENNTVSLQALDPDKAIGECPCITYYDTDTRKIRKAYYFTPVPADIYDYLGVSCYRVEEDIGFAIANGLRHLELRKNILRTDRNRLVELVEKWRACGGKTLSVHLMDVGFEAGEVLCSSDYSKLVTLARDIGADRLTQHVPRLSAEIQKEYPDALSKIADFVSKSVSVFGGSVTLGIENMHTTSKDDDRCGFTPEQCHSFMRAVASKCDCKVGINFDIGHARNNAPYSQTYQVGSWMAMIGTDTVGYHIHQVIKTEYGFENHMPITDIHGALINFTSFFKNWSVGNINKAPLILEMRPENAYELTLSTLNRYKDKKVFDLHSHTYYSRCGRDAPESVIKTAIANGISVLGITDHAHGIGDRINEYMWEIRAASKKYKDKITVLGGIEIATLPPNFDEHITEKIKNFDYCLIEHITASDSRVGKNLIEFCKKAGIPCGIAHTDLFKYCDIYGYDYEKFFSELAKHGIFWELNVNYDSIHNYCEHVYVREFMNDADKINIVKHSGLKVSIGFDSHRCDEYDGNAVHSMYVFLRQKGIDTFTCRM